MTDRDARLQPPGSVVQNVSSMENVGLHRFALLTSGLTFVLIFVGGLVTSTGSALAVPDWPLSFGKFFPKMEGGVLYEHGHRMVAGAVAILTLALCLWASRREPRAWVRRTAVVALALVLFQAVLGGLTVLLLLPLPIAVAHAACAQAFFCMTVALALFTGRQWFDTPSLACHSEASAAQPKNPEFSASLQAFGFRALTAATTAVIYLQILIGAVMRHMGAGLAIPDFPLSYGRLIPPLNSELVAVNFAHRCGAVIVTAFVAATVAVAMTRFSQVRALRRPALAMMLLLAVQIFLGALTVWTQRAVIPTTAHVAIGAAVLASSLTLTIRSFHLLSPGRAVRDVREFPLIGATSRQVTA